MFMHERLLEQLEARRMLSAGSISGVVFNDLNRTGARDAVESGRANVVVYIDANNNGKRDRGERAVVSSQNGTFHFGKPSPGNYNIRAVAPAGFERTSANAVYRVKL